MATWPTSQSAGPDGDIQNSRVFSSSGGLTAERRGDTSTADGPSHFKHGVLLEPWAVLWPRGGITTRRRWGAKARRQKWAVGETGDDQQRPTPTQASITSIKMSAGTPVQWGGRERERRDGRHHVSDREMRWPLVASTTDDVPRSNEAPRVVVGRMRRGGHV